MLVRVGHGKRLEHNGIRVECVGAIGRLLMLACNVGHLAHTHCHIVVLNDSSQSKEFQCLSQELAAPGEIRQNTTMDFEFRNVEKQYECYYGINVQLRYAS